MTGHRDWERCRGPILYRLEQGWTLEALAARYMCSRQTLQRKINEWRPTAPSIADEPPQDAGGPSDGMSPGPEPIPDYWLDPPVVDHEPQPSPVVDHHQPEPPPQESAADLNKRREARIIELGMPRELSPQTILGTILDENLGPFTRSGVVAVLRRHGIARTREQVMTSINTEARIADHQQPKRKPGQIDPAKYEREAPPTAVKRDHLKGCIWPYGEPRDGLVYCNAPCCRVQMGDRVTQTRYCAEHWEARRASRHTRILA